MYDWFTSFSMSCSSSVYFCVNFHWKQKKKKDLSCNKRKMSNWNKLGRACYKIIAQPHATDHRQPITNPLAGSPLTHQPTDHITAERTTDHRPNDRIRIDSLTTDHQPPIHRQVIHWLIDNRPPTHQHRLVVSWPTDYWK